MSELTKGIVVGLIIGLVAGLVAGVAVGRWLAAARARAKAGGSAKVSGDDFSRLLGTAGPLASGVPVSSSADEIAGLRQNLRVKFLHDEEKVNHAIQLERQGNPGASEIEWLRAAIYRWERDNR
jgi:hypothetical protein